MTKATIKRNSQAVKLYPNKQKLAGVSESLCLDCLSYVTIMKKATELCS
jgi:hypothetical protein